MLESRREGYLFTNGLCIVSMVEKPPTMIMRKFIFFSKRIIYNFIVFGIDNGEEIEQTVERGVSVLSVMKKIIIQEMEDCWDPCALYKNWDLEKEISQ